MNRSPFCSSKLCVEQLEDRLNPDSSTIPAGEFNWTQYSPTGELAQLVWEGQTLVYQERVNNAWQQEPIAAASDFTQAQYSTRDQVQEASSSAQLVFTSDGTPHVLFLQETWVSSANAYQTLIQHYDRVGGVWQHVETIAPPWLSPWGPSNLVAEPGPDNTLHILFSETYTAATGVGNFGSGILWYGTDQSGSWQFSDVATTADPKVDVWFAGGDWAPRFISMAIDSNNNAYITYTPEFYIAGAFSTVYSQLNFATNASGSFQTSVIYTPQDGTADAGLGASIALNPVTGQVAVASYYVDRYDTGSPETSMLMYHTRNADGTWTTTDVVTAPDGYVAADGAKFTGFAPQLFFDTSGNPSIVFSDEAGQHLPVTYANEYAGQIRMATMSGGQWTVQTVFHQTDPLHNQLFYPVAATFDGQTMFAGLQVVSQTDGNLNITSSSYSIVDIDTPAGPPSAPPVISPPISPPSPPGVVRTVANSSTATDPAGAVAMAVATDAQPGVTTTVAVYDADGSLDFTITPFGPNYSGGARVARADVNGDGIPDVIVGSGGGIQARVRIWDGATHQLIFDETPFEDFTGGIVLATGDLNGDGIADVIIGPDVGGGPRIQVWAGSSSDSFQKLMPDFYGLPYPTFRGGLRLAAADVNDDGIADLIVAPGAGGGPRITIYNGSTLTSASGPQLLVNDFYAFDSSLRTGLYLAAGDVDGDGYADIIVGMGTGGSPEVRVISGKDLALGLGTQAIADFYVGNASETDGARVAVTNIDSDGKSDVLVGTEGGQLSLITGDAITSSMNPTPALSFAAFSGIYGGVYVG